MEVWTGVWSASPSQMVSCNQRERVRVSVVGSLRKGKERLRLKLEKEVRRGGDEVGSDEGRSVYDSP